MRILLFVLLIVAAPAFAQDDSGLGIPSGVYAIDKGHTYVSFSYLHQGLSYPRLRAADVDGELTLNAGSPGDSQVAISIAVDSIRSNIDYFDEELASPKFFNAAKFPHITFVADSMDMASAEGGMLQGVITIRGISRPLSLDVKINGAMTNPITNKPVIGVSATGALNRSEFELDRFIPAVSDQVTLRIEAEFAQGSNEGSASAAALALGAASDD